jgi:hypothetical protein
MAFPQHSSSHSPTQDCCGQPMTLVRIDPKVSSFPELRTFRCDLCGEVRTVEAGPSIAQ